MYHVNLQETFPEKGGEKRTHVKMTIPHNGSSRSRDSDWEHTEEVEP